MKIIAMWGWGELPGKGKAHPWAHAHLPGHVAQASS